MMKKNLLSKLFLLMLFPLLFFSCMSLPKDNVFCSRELSGKPVKNQNQLVEFFLSENPEFDKNEISILADYYIDEAKTENINSDVAFVQMCLETGFLQFGNLVTKEMNNFCGLGAIDENHRGEKFETPLLGVRAHIQHLQAYATTQDVKLNNELIDPRYNWVHKTKLAKNVFELSGAWATDLNYGKKLDGLLTKLEQF